MVGGPVFSVRCNGMTIAKFSLFQVVAILLRSIGWVPLRAGLWEVQVDTGSYINSVSYDFSLMPVTGAADEQVPE